MRYALILLLMLAGCSGAPKVPHVPVKPQVDLVKERIVEASLGLQSHAAGVNESMAAIGGLGFPAGSEPYTAAIAGHVAAIDMIGRELGGPVVAEIDRVAVAAKRADKRVADLEAQIESDRRATAKALRHAAVWCSLIGALTLAGGVYLLISGGWGFARLVMGAGGILMGAGSILFFYADWLWLIQWVIGVGFLVLLVAVVYANRDLLRLWRAGRAMVKGVEESPPYSNVKKLIAEAAGPDLHEVKRTIGEIKEEVL